MNLDVRILFVTGERAWQSRAAPAQKPGSSREREQQTRRGHGKVCPPGTASVAYFSYLCPISHFLQVPNDAMQ